MTTYTLTIESSAFDQLSATGLASLRNSLTDVARAMAQQALGYNADLTVTYARADKPNPTVSTCDSDEAAIPVHTFTVTVPAGLGRNREELRQSIGNTLHRSLANPFWPGLAPADVHVGIDHSNTSKEPTHETPSTKLSPNKPADGAIGSVGRLREWIRQSPKPVSSAELFDYLSDQLHVERAEWGRADQLRAERERVERERAEWERIQRERIERERIKRERIERERIKRERIERERIERERIERTQRECAAFFLSRPTRNAPATGPNATGPNATGPNAPGPNATGQPAAHVDPATGPNALGPAALGSDGRS